MKRRDKKRKESASLEGEKKTRKKRAHAQDLTETTGKPTVPVTTRRRKELMETVTSAIENHDIKTIESLRETLAYRNKSDDETLSVLSVAIERGNFAAFVELQWGCNYLPSETNSTKVKKDYETITLRLLERAAYANRPWIVRHLLVSLPGYTPSKSVIEYAVATEKRHLLRVYLTALPSGHRNPPHMKFMTMIHDIIEKAILLDKVWAFYELMAANRLNVRVLDDRHYMELAQMHNAMNVLDYLKENFGDHDDTTKLTLLDLQPTWLTIFKFLTFKDHFCGLAPTCRETRFLCSRKMFQVGEVSNATQKVYMSMVASTTQKMTMMRKNAPQSLRHNPPFQFLRSLHFKNAADDMVTRRVNFFGVLGKACPRLQTLYCPKWVDDKILLKSPIPSSILHLSLRNSAIGTREPLRGLRALVTSNVVELDLSFSRNLTDAGLAELAGSKVNTLMLDGCSINGSGLAKLKGLELLSLVSVGNMLDENLNFDTSCLRYLYLNGCDKLTGSGFRFLEGAPLVTLEGLDSLPLLAYPPPTLASCD